MENTYKSKIVRKILDILNPNKKIIENSLLNLMAIFKPVQTTLQFHVALDNVIYFIEQINNHKTNEEIAASQPTSAFIKQNSEKFELKKHKLEVKSRSKNLTQILVFVLLVIVLILIFRPEEFYMVLVALLSFICCQTLKTHFSLKDK